MAKDTKVYEKFMDNLIDQKTPVVVFLINGVKLQGVVDDFDEVVLLLKRDQNIQLLYRKAISTIVPQYRTDNA